MNRYKTGDKVIVKGQALGKSFKDAKGIVLSCLSNKIARHALMMVKVQFSVDDYHSHMRWFTCSDLKRIKHEKV